MCPDSTIYASLVESVAALNVGRKEGYLRDEAYRTCLWTEHGKEGAQMTLPVNTPIALRLTSLSLLMDIHCLSVGPKSGSPFHH